MGLLHEVPALRLSYDSKDDLYVTMPQRSYEKDGDIRYADVFHPVTREARNVLTDTVLAAYKRALE